MDSNEQLKVKINNVGVASLTTLKLGDLRNSKEWKYRDIIVISVAIA